MQNSDYNVIKFNGGLGNQMFQYAFARSLEISTGAKSLFDMSFFEKKYARPFEMNIFNVAINPVTSLFDKFKLQILWNLRKKMDGKALLGTKMIMEPHFHFSSDLLNVAANNYVEGFFQSEKYFNNIEQIIREELQFAFEPDELNQSFIDKIKGVNSVSLHIRRGDYVQKKRYQNLYASCSLDYYKRGVELIANKVDNPILFIFSDDIEWVKENLKLPYECIYVSHNTGAKSFEDMRLMSLCKHNVIANSSFSWWGAWLNNNQEKLVIAPRKWFNDEKINQEDVIPERWIRIEN